MNLQSVDKIKTALDVKEINPKEVCDWDNTDEVEKLVAMLKEMQG
jgi:hypothetical protein